jgi:hypothetical protein
MNQFAIAIDGFDETDRRIAGLTDSMRDEIIVPAVREGAELVVDDARAHAPRVSGALADAVGILAIELPAKDLALVSIGNLGGVLYFNWVVHGHRAGPRRFGNRRRWVEGNEFIQDAYANKCQEVQELVSERVLEGIERELA